jgi:hypothetical protein
VSQSVNESVEIGEIVGIVSVRHDHVPAFRRFDSPNERGTIASAIDTDNAGASGLRDRLRTVHGAVVGDQDFAVDSSPFQIGEGFSDANLDRKRLV